MNNKKNKGKIYPIKWSPISHDTNFITYFFESKCQWLEFKEANRKTTQHAPITLSPVVDKDGNVFNPVTPVIFFLN